MRRESCQWYRQRIFEILNGSEFRVTIPLTAWRREHEAMVALSCNQLHIWASRANNGAGQTGRSVVMAFSLFLLLGFPVLRSAGGKSSGGTLGGAVGPAGRGTCFTLGSVLLSVFSGVAGV
jgi:hypothetical protein